ncbi:MAG: RnfABCDGE type electron transport complex subunit D [Eubacterium sp.]|jgi:electron transport complex protein RnfD|nr:RnfABCDGE type electron transport complex subunit D [Eubacterium sp.]
MEKLFIGPSPHIRSGNSTMKIMLTVIISLIPTLVAAVYYFGARALILTVVCVVFCVIFEFLFNKITKREQTVSDLSAVVTGVILAFNLPVSLPYYMAIIGCFIAIVVVKQMFGGIGQNFANPAITARIALMLSFTSHMSSYPVAFYYKSGGADIVTGATPLTVLKEGGTASFSLSDMFFGNHGGSLGETCALTLLIGLAFLLLFRVIHPATPFAYIGTVAVISFFTGLNGDVLYNVLFNLLSGGLLLGAVFMVTDYSTTPISAKGKLIFGIGCGCLTMLIRSFASMPEGVSFSILIMNILTPFIDKATMPKPFGIKKEVKSNG